MLLPLLPLDATSKTRGLGAGRKLRTLRREERWADKEYCRSNLGSEWKKPFAGTSHSKGIVLEKMCVAQGGLLCAACVRREGEACAGERDNNPRASGQQARLPARAANRPRSRHSCGCATPRELTLSLACSGIEAKQPNSAIRKCVRVQLIKNGKKIACFVPNDGCLNFIDENVRGDSQRRRAACLGEQGRGEGLQPPATLQPTRRRLAPTLDTRAVR